jgi:hypothetical protein
VVFTIALFMVNGFDINEFTTVMAVVTPVFAGFTTSIIAFIIKDAKVIEDTTARVSTAYVALTFSLPLLLAAVIALSIGLKTFNLVFANFEDFKRFLLLAETLFSGYVGMFVYSLFDKKAPEGAAREPGRPSRWP